VDQRRIIEAKAILDDAMERHNPSHIFGMFSGGHDNLCATHIAAQSLFFSGAAHMNTTIGIEETRDFVRATCKEQNWQLKEYKPPVSYDDIVLKHGFPGPGGHFYMYIRLKERCLAQLLKEHKGKTRTDRVLLVTGVRLAESERRMGHVEAVVQEGRKVWVAPILNWTTEDKNEYIDLHKLKRNPVVDKLCMSGECLCGAFAHPGEMAELEAAYPETADRIKALEGKVALNGLPAKWGQRPEKPVVELEPMPMAMCWSCEAKRVSETALAN
jgi:3'-phosphoadenosine 5'-phosphosulfate sulfotransferase (PAPS reductase)/FAD synthetase